MNAKTKEAMFNLHDELGYTLSSDTTIEVSRDDLVTVVNHLYDSGDEWDNHAALGYAIAAARSAGLNYRQIKNLSNEMRREFDFTTLQAAAEFYRKSDY